MAERNLRKGTKKLSSRERERGSRQFAEILFAFATGRFRHGVPMGIDPEGKVLGILGMGGIGKAVAKRMLGFDMKIQYHNRSRLDAEGKRKKKLYIQIDAIKVRSVLIIKLLLA